MPSRKYHYGFMNFTIFVTSIYHGKMHEIFLQITNFFNNSQYRLLLVKMSIKKISRNETFKGHYKSVLTQYRNCGKLLHVPGYTHPLNVVNAIVPVIMTGQHCTDLQKN